MCTHTYIYTAFLSGPRAALAFNLQGNFRFQHAHPLQPLLAPAREDSEVPPIPTPVASSTTAEWACEQSGTMYIYM